jgi:hypothetical protein
MRTAVLRIRDKFLRWIRIRCPEPDPVSVTGPEVRNRIRCPEPDPVSGTGTGVRNRIRCPNDIFALEKESPLYCLLKLHFTLTPREKSMWTQIV